MKLNRVDQFGKIVRLAEARKAYASVAEDIKPDTDVITALSQLMESMAKIAEAKGEENVGPEDIEAAMEQLAAKGFRVDASPDYFEANAHAVEEMMKTAGIWDSIGTGVQKGMGAVERGAAGLEKGWQAGQQALQKGWQTAKDLAGKTVNLPGQAAGYVKEKAQEVQTNLVQKAREQMANSLQNARASFKNVADVLSGKSNRINLATLRNFSAALAGLLNAATTMYQRNRPSVRPEAAGTVPGGRNTTIPTGAPAQAPAAKGTGYTQVGPTEKMPAAAKNKGTMVRIAGWDEAAFEKADAESRICKGYDGQTYTVGDRVELHPGTDLWMQGARYGTVVGVVPTSQDRVRVKLDKLPNRTFSGPEERFRKA